MCKLALSCTQCLRVQNFSESSPFEKKLLVFDQGGERKLQEGIWGLTILYADFQPTAQFSDPFLTSLSEVCETAISDLFEGWRGWD